MIGFHIQNSPRDWTDALRICAPIKFCFGVERCREAREIDPSAVTWYRWVGEQPLPPINANFEQHARYWLARFIDGTFRNEAHNVSYIQEYNETLANSQGAEERLRWIKLHTAMAKVWNDEYRREPELAHIEMILCETAIGNDIPIEIAAAAVKYDALLGYHPYQVCRCAHAETRTESLSPGRSLRFDGPRAQFTEPGIYKMRTSIDVRSTESLEAEAAVNHPYFVSPHDWRWYSGRWSYMDDEFAAQGVKPRWAFGEMGPVLDASPDWSGWLDPMGGWKHKDCLDGDFDKYLAVQDYWLQNTMRTQAYKDGRILDGTLFTSGAPGSGADWSAFDLVQPEMNRFSEFICAYNFTPTEPPDPEPPDPPDPPVDPDPPDPPAAGNLLVNPSFEDGWTDLSAHAQQPNGWILEFAPIGAHVRGREVDTQPKCSHKHEALLPPDEWPGGENELILDGRWVFKIYGTGVWAVRLKQTVYAEPGIYLLMTAPVNAHLDDRPDGHDPEDTLIDISAGGCSYDIWVTKGNDRVWRLPTFDCVVPADGKLDVSIAISVKWEHPTSIFLDDLRLEVLTPNPEPDCKGLPRVPYSRTVHVLPKDATLAQLQQVTELAYPQRQTVGFSYDDAGIGDLADKTAVLWGIPPIEREKFLNWYKQHYPRTAVQFENLLQPGLFADVSHHQGAIDWPTMAKNGITHCYIRATYGKNMIDTRYYENVKGAKKAGIKIGAYHFYVYSQSGIEQANFFCDVIADDIGSLPPAVDIEKTDQVAAPDPRQIQDCLVTIERLTERVPAIYTNVDSWYDLPGDQPWAARYPLWAACWTSAPAPLIPHDWETWWLWQYGQTEGQPFGVQSSFLDMNRINNGS